MDAINQILRQTFSTTTGVTNDSRHAAMNNSFDITNGLNKLPTKPASNIANGLLAGIFGATDAIAGETWTPANGVTSIDADGVPSFDENHPAYHHYFTSNSCSKSEPWCTFDSAVQGLLRYPAPGASGNPVHDEQTGFATPVGYVTHEVYDGGARIYNITQEGRHLLDPGIVKRWISESQNTVSINTFGEGTGNMGGLNSWLADPLWKEVDGNIFDYMHKH